jgi:hypothetical protein
MRLSPRGLRPPDRCDELRPRRHGYQLRCLEAAGHTGPHLWTPELVERPGHRDTTRPSVARRLARLLADPARTLRS